MTFQARIIQGVTVLTTDLPRLDASNAPHLRAALLAEIDDGAASLVVDLSGVAFLGSSALGALSAAANRMAPKRGPAVAGTQPPVAPLFALTPMDRVFAIHSDADEAVARFSA